MGTYDNAAGYPLHNPMFDEFPPCAVCGLDPSTAPEHGGCACPQCPKCGMHGCEHQQQKVRS